MIDEQLPERLRIPRGRQLRLVPYGTDTAILRTVAPEEKESGPFRLQRLLDRKQDRLEQGTGIENSSISNAGRAR